MSSLCVLGYIWMTLNLFFSDSYQTSVCLFHRISGLPCPSCGTTRAINAIFNGQFINAFLINPLGYFALLILLIVPFWLIYDIFRKQDSFYQTFIKVENKIKQTKPLALVLISLAIINWIWNIYKEL
ncbi:MAG: DUF2752 domain-containing protein [Chitinophagales bacterium]|nr:DUF2752 domain-containing protein [Chitinophagales bacterium]